ncbi:uncharacterized protein A4U43_C08F32670 [Asparagus officinalis]|nr:uncharacterized protein A4U43_C08F32670 [Asparagus officinalis]
MLAGGVARAKVVGAGGPEVEEARRKKARARGGRHGRRREAGRGEEGVEEGGARSGGGEGAEGSKGARGRRRGGDEQRLNECKTTVADESKQTLLAMLFDSQSNPSYSPSPDVAHVLWMYLSESHGSINIL